MKNENYINIQGWMIKELKLKSNELILYAIIYGFSQDGQSEYYGSVRYIANALSLSIGGVHKLLVKLIERKLIIRTSESHYSVHKVNASVHKVNAECSQSEQIKNNSNNKENNNLESFLIDPPKETYKSKQDIAKQKGIKLKKIKKTDKQEIAVKALLAVTHFKNEMLTVHGMVFLKKDNERNKKVVKLAKGVYEEIGEDITGLIDWFVLEDNDWCKYKPENCFSDVAVEQYLNKDKGSSSKMHEL